MDSVCARGDRKHQRLGHGLLPAASTGLMRQPGEAKVAPNLAWFPSVSLVTKGWYKVRQETYRTQVGLFLRVAHIFRTARSNPG